MGYQATLYTKIRGFSKPILGSCHDGNRIMGIIWNHPNRGRKKSGGKQIVPRFLVGKRCFFWGDSEVVEAQFLEILGVPILGNLFIQ